jgi:hypothetical protein
LTFETSIRQERLDFGQTKYGSAALAAVLNRDSGEGSISMRYEVTPLTTFVVTSALRHDRFETARQRDSDSLSVIPGFQFKPFALISGSAAVGFRKFTTRDAAVPDYSGLVANVDISYVARDLTKFAFRIGRDVDYSFDPQQPFFVATTRSLSVTQALGYDWDAVGRAALDTLSYRGLNVATTGRSERVVTYGAGVGRRLGDSLRIGFDLDYSRRHSDIAVRTYDGMRVGGSVTYGY